MTKYDVVVNWRTVKSGFTSYAQAERWALSNLNWLDLEEDVRIIAWDDDSTDNMNLSGI